MADLFLPEGMPVPAPDPSGFDAPFWDALKQHELRIQHCTKCGTFRHTPEVVCWKCRSFDHDWPQVSGNALVYSAMNVIYPPHPALKDRGEFNVVVVELPDAGNVRMVGNIVDADYSEIKVGMPVKVHFENRPEGVTLPLWKKS